MAHVPVKFETAITDNFTGRMARAAEVAKSMHVAFALAEATWEPHDWREF